MIVGVQNIYILTDVQFPIGLAPTNRVIAYAKGFVSLNRKVKIICFRKTETNSIQNKSTKGAFQGVDFQYLSNSTIKSKFFLKRIVDKFLMDFRLLRFSLICIDKSSIVIYYSVSVSGAFIVKAASLYNGFVLLKEETEHPSVRVRRLSYVSSFLFQKFHYPLFDGYLLITQNLVDYFKSTYPRKPSLHVPMMVDFSRFKLVNKREKTIIYCGILSNSKDGIEILVEAFSMLIDKFPEYTLVLIGEFKTQKEQEEHRRFVINLGIKGKVIYKGRISNEQIPLEISKASVLVLPRPDNIQTRAGFPTKLGEYLATGNAVVATSVGEIPMYLKDGKNAFLAKPGSVLDFSNKLVEALSDEKLSKEIGMNGRATAQLHFSNIKITSSVIYFAKEIQS